ncbi:hypothetical protein CEXT_154121 [Caerostris extrusa]|uniref:Uncharacterized protein n=1 Tax=Caerostris extrusa TaxID=172846 RepID=A0AAV4RCH1_CAEEX|nr:hypothetical protein CEXT_154121 [Caerostris extrusa]
MDILVTVISSHLFILASVQNTSWRIGIRHAASLWITNAVEYACHTNASFSNVAHNNDTCEISVTDFCHLHAVFFQHCQNKISLSNVIFGDGMMLSSLRYLPNRFNLTEMLFLPVRLFSGVLYSLDTFSWTKTIKFILQRLPSSFGRNYSSHISALIVHRSKSH